MSTALILLLCVGGAISCCNAVHRPTSAVNKVSTAPSINSAIVLQGALSPEEALAAYRESSARQAATLTGFSDEAAIEAELPSTSQKGQYWLKQTYSAPRSLTYKAINFVGDGFVKNNVITRLLQSDADRVEKGTGPKYAISESNYRFSYKGIENLDGRSLYVFTVKPLRKAPGLFEGRVLIGPYTGHIVRAMGRLSKSPSLWVKRIDFLQDYIDVGPFTMVAQIQSVARALIVGKVVVNIRYSCYEVQSIEHAKAEGVDVSNRTGSDRGCLPQERSTEISHSPATAVGANLESN